MKGYKVFILAAVGFIVVSAILYYVHYLIFHDTHHIFIFMLHDFAFLPLEVFLVVIVIERILTRREPTYLAPPHSLSRNELLNYQNGKKAVMA